MQPTPQWNAALNKGAVLVEFCASTRRECSDLSRGAGNRGKGGWIVLRKQHSFVMLVSKHWRPQTLADNMHITAQVHTSPNTTAHCISNP